MINICSIDGCEKKVAARGWCDKHYYRFRKHGDPLKVKVIRTDGTLEERFRAKLKEISSGCIEWRGGKTKTGYGVIGAPKTGKNMMTHRVAWEFENGPIPDGMCVLHKCDNPSCCNPDHLFLGTLKENSGDMVRKQRFPVPRNGTRVPDEMVLEAISLRKSGMKLRHVHAWMHDQGYPVSKSAIKNWGNHNRRHLAELY